MPIYLAIPLQESSKLNAAVEQYISSPSDRHQLQADRGWFIKFTGTTVELSNLLRITGQAEGEKPTVGSALIVPVSTYFGRGPTPMWEWLKSRMEE